MRDSMLFTTYAYDCELFPPGKKAASCSDGTLPLKEHDRAWTSPIWYQP